LDYNGLLKTPKWTNSLKFFSTWKWYNFQCVIHGHWI
jgi:hypothetical protein